MSALTSVQKLENGLRSIVPAEVFSAASRVQEQAEAEFEVEARLVPGASGTRRDEFLTGRHCARRALRSLGVEAVPLLRDDDGLPVWPHGCIGSITHSKGLACAVAARENAFQLLGLDLEKTDRLTSAAMDRILHPSESCFVDGEQRLASLLFSAKEAFFKAQYPAFGASPEFKDIAFAVDLAAGRLTVKQAAAHLSNDLRVAAGAMQFRFCWIGDYVLTLSALPR